MAVTRLLTVGHSSCSFKGYCSENGRCITVKSEVGPPPAPLHPGPSPLTHSSASVQEFLDRLDDFISGLSVSGSVNWIKANWPYLLMGLGGVIILCLLLRVCVGWWTTSVTAKQRSSALIARPNSLSLTHSLSLSCCPFPRPPTRTKSAGATAPTQPMTMRLYLWSSATGRCCISGHWLWGSSASASHSHSAPRQLGGDCGKPQPRAQAAQRGLPPCGHVQGHGTPPAAQRRH